MQICTEIFFKPTPKRQKRNRVLCTKIAASKCTQTNCSFNLAFASLCSGDHDLDDVDWKWEVDLKVWPTAEYWFHYQNQSTTIQGAQKDATVLRLWLLTRPVFYWHAITNDTNVQKKGRGDTSRHKKRPRPNQRLYMSSQFCCLSRKAVFGSFEGSFDSVGSGTSGTGSRDGIGSGQGGGPWAKEGEA